MSHSGTGPVVSFENVSKHYGQPEGGRRAEPRAPPGETVALLGPNGAGKSTSLDMLLALRKPTGGQIRMFGSDPYHAVKSGRVGAMLQSGGLMPEVTVARTGQPGREPAPAAGAGRHDAARAGIDEFADQRVDRLSGGQTQRVRFALAIAGECDLIVLDEPTTAMDVETRQRFWATMKEEVAEGKTLLFATHYLEEADQAADRILVINRGRLLADGTPGHQEAGGRQAMSFRLGWRGRAVPARPARRCQPGDQARPGAHPDRATPTRRCTGCSTPATGRPRSRSAASALSRRSSPSPRKTTGPTATARVTRRPARRTFEQQETRDNARHTAPCPRQAEINRLRRNKRYLFFTSACRWCSTSSSPRRGRPWTASTSRPTTWSRWRSFGAFSGALNGNAIRISQERKVGWIRQLRLTPLPANSYVVAKILTSVALTAPSIVIVLLLGRFDGSVHLPVWQWTRDRARRSGSARRSSPRSRSRSATGTRRTQAQPIIDDPLPVVLLFGGLWFPFTGGLGDVRQGTPTFGSCRSRPTW